MTEKLYEQNPYLREFSAVVTGCSPVPGGFAVTLDRTAFFPEGGGQPGDTGTLCGEAVADTRLQGGEIVHLCARPLPVGETVQGQIDWDRRFDLMQQHSGEHLVSGLAHTKFGCDNVGFHMGHDFVTIDLSAVLSEDDLRELEAAANRAVWQDLPSEVLIPGPDALQTIPYRSKKELDGQVRLVRFPGVDTCACCGTHVARTGEIGLIRLFSCARFRTGVRIELLCGGRCLRYLCAMQEQNRQVSSLLSARPPETADAVRRVLAELEAARSYAAALEDAAFRQKAAAYRGAGDCALFEPPMAPERVRKLCERVRETCGGRCAVFSGGDKEYLYAIGGGGGEDLRGLAKALNQALRGRGGGKPDFVQGSVAAARAEIEAFLREK